MRFLIYMSLFIFILSGFARAQMTGVNTSTGLNPEFDQDYLFNYTLYNSNVNLRSTGSGEIYIQVLFNTPEYIEQYYSDYSRYARLPKPKAIHLIERNFDYARRYLWFEITVRANRVEDLLWNGEDCFVLVSNLGQKLRPMVVGRGTVPKYKPIEVDGHIYDELVWEKTFGIKFSTDILDEDACELTLKSLCWHKILGSWEITPELRSQYLLRKCASQRFPY